MLIGICKKTDYETLRAYNYKPVRITANMPVLGGQNWQGRASP
jgi:hypothetical protein